MDLAVCVWVDTVVGLSGRVEAGEVINDDDARCRRRFRSRELGDASVELSDPGVGVHHGRRDDLREEKRGLGSRLADSVDELGELVERALDVFALEHVVRSEVDQKDVGLAVFDPAPDTIEDLVDTPSPMAFVIAVEVVREAADPGGGLSGFRRSRR